MAISVHCRDSAALLELTAPRALTVDTLHCRALRSLTAPVATNVCCGHTSVTLLNLPSVRMLSCFHCSSLTSIVAPRAVEIACGWCRSLTTIPLVQYLLYAECPWLGGWAIQGGSSARFDRSLESLVKCQRIARRALSRKRFARRRPAVVSSSAAASAKIAA